MMLAALLHDAEKSDNIIMVKRVEDISMKLQISALQYLTRNDFYFVQPLVSAEQFLTFCTN